MGCEPYYGGRAARGMRSGQASRGKRHAGRHHLPSLPQQPSGQRWGRASRPAASSGPCPRSAGWGGCRQRQFSNNPPRAGLAGGAAVASPALSSTLVPEAEVPVRPGPHTVPRQRRGPMRDLWGDVEPRQLSGAKTVPPGSLHHSSAPCTQWLWSALASSTFGRSLPNSHSCLQALSEKLPPNAETQHPAHPPWAATHPQDGAGWRAGTHCPGPISLGIMCRLDTARCGRKPGSSLPSCCCCVGRKARSSPTTRGVSIGNGTDPRWMGHGCSSPG